MHRCIVPRFEITRPSPEMDGSPGGRQRMHAAAARARGGSPAKRRGLQRRGKQPRCSPHHVSPLQGCNRNATLVILCMSNCSEMSAVEIASGRSCLLASIINGTPWSSPCSLTVSAVTTTTTATTTTRGDEGEQKTLETGCTRAKESKRQQAQNVFTFNADLAPPPPRPTHCSHSRSCKQRQDGERPAAMRSRWGGVALLLLLLLWA